MISATLSYGPKIPFNYEFRVGFSYAILFFSRIFEGAILTVDVEQKGIMNTFVYDQYWQIKSTKLHNRYFTALYVHSIYKTE